MIVTMAYDEDLANRIRELHSVAFARALPPKEKK